MTTYYRDIEAAKSEVTQLKGRYLQRFGWKSTCNTPGAYWLWERDFRNEDAERARIVKERNLPSPALQYGVMRVPEDIAVSMTVRCLDKQPENNEDSE